jgi:hypothetical protein
MNKWNMLKPKLLKQLLPKPVKADQVEVSMVASMHDETAVPTAWLLDICLHATEEARTANLSDVSQRIKDGPDYPGIWPGEHYKLLAGFVKSLKPNPRSCQISAENGHDRDFRPGVLGQGDDDRSQEIRFL